MPLTDTAVRNAKGKEKPYKLGDGGWLFLLVNPDSRRYWPLSFCFAGKQRPDPQVLSGDLGSRHTNQSEKRTVGAMQIGGKKVWAHRSERVAMRPASLSLANRVSTLPLGAEGSIIGERPLAAQR